MQLAQITRETSEAAVPPPLPPQPQGSSPPGAGAAASAPPPLPWEGEVTGPPRRRSGGDLGWLPLAAAGACLIAGVFLWRFVFIDSTPPHAPGAVKWASHALPESMHVDVNRSQWPAAFQTAPQPSGNSAPHLSGSLLSRQVLGDMTKTYGSYTEQIHRVRILGSRFADLRDDLTSAENRFDRNYRRAVDTIDWTLTDWSPKKWPLMRRDVQAAAQQADAKPVTVSQAEQFLNDLRQRAQGHLPAPQLEILLAFDPEYVAHPVHEMEDGFVEEFESDGSGAAHGLRVRIQYPRSWMASTPAGGRTVRLFRDRRCALNVASVRVDDVPRPSVTSGRDLVELYALNDIREVSPDAKFLAGGIVTLANLNDCLWREFRFTRTIQGHSYKMRAIDFAAVRVDQYVSIGFTVAAAASAPDSELDAIYARHAPLFKMMLSSVQLGQ